MTRKRSVFIPSGLLQAFQTTRIYIYDVIFTGNESVCLVKDRQQSIRPILVWSQYIED